MCFSIGLVVFCMGRSRNRFVKIQESKDKEIPTCCFSAASAVGLIAQATASSIWLIDGLVLIDGGECMRKWLDGGGEC